MHCPAFAGTSMCVGKGTSEIAFVQVSGQVECTGAELPDCQRRGFKPACKSNNWLSNHTHPTPTFLCSAAFMLVK